MTRKNVSFTGGWVEASSTLKILIAETSIPSTCQVNTFFAQGCGGGGGGEREGVIELFSPVKKIVDAGRFQ